MPCHIENALKPHLRLRRTRALWVLGATVLVLSAGGAYADQEDPQVLIEGFLPDTASMFPIALDRDLNRLYAITWNEGLFEFDLSVPIQQARARPLADVPRTKWLGGWTYHDQLNHKLYMLDEQTRMVRILDLLTREVSPKAWDLSKMLPGVWWQGITYSHKDQRIYLIGLLPFERATVTAKWAPSPVIPIAIAAIDVQQPAASGLAWVRTIKTCTLPMNDQTVGAKIFRSSHDQALYFACSRADVTQFNVQLPGHAGIVRLWIDPAGNQEAAFQPGGVFREEFFRMSGAFKNPSGMFSRTDFDYASNRLSVVSASTQTPGVWIFDGTLSAFPGFGLTTSSNNDALGIDPQSGTAVVKDKSGALLVIASRATPSILGNRFTLPEEVSAGADIYLFDAHGRMYWGNGKQIVVAQVPAVAERVSEVLDFDSLTDDVDEGPLTNVTYTGTAAGFGARVSVVGGVGGATSPTRPGFFSRSFDKLGNTPFLAPGDRGAHLGHMPGLDLRNQDVQALAQPVSPDDLTSNDERNLRGTDLHGVALSAGRLATEAASRDIEYFEDVVAPLGSLPDGVRKPASSTSQPWPKAFCVDGAFAADEDRREATSGDPAGIGTAHVECDYKTSQVTALANTNGARLEEVVIGEASIISMAKRDPGRIVVDSHARSRNIQVPFGGGRLQIAEVSLDVVSVAGGRTGTARVEWNRVIQGVELRDLDGKVLLSCDVCDMDVVAEQINDLVGGDIKMIVPTPEITTTPRGAHSRFKKSAGHEVNDLVMNNDASEAMPALQLEIYSDFADKSRTVVQLAAIDSSAIYGIRRGVEEVPYDPPLVPPFDPPQLDDFTPPPPTVTPPSGPDGYFGDASPSQGVIQRLVRQALFIARSPAEGLSMILLLSLTVGFVVLSARRRALGGVL